MKITFCDGDSELFKDVFTVLGTIEQGGVIALQTSGTTGTPKNVSQSATDALAKKRGGNAEQKFLLTYSPTRWAGVSVILHCFKF